MPIPGLAARRFTSTAIDIVEQMCPRAAERGMATGCTERTAPMLALWSLLRWERKVGLVALERLGVEIDALARDADWGLSEACAEPGQPIEPAESQALSAGRRVVDFDTPLRPLLAAAEDEALGLGHNWVGSEHLLLAVVRLASPELGELLSRHGVVYDRLRQSIVAVLQS